MADLHPQPETAASLAAKPSSVVGRSIAFKLTLFVFVLLILMAAAITGVGYVVARGIVRNQIHQRIDVAAIDRHAMVHSYVAQQHERVSLVASRTRLRQLNVLRYMTKPVIQSELLNTILNVAGAELAEDVPADASTGESSAQQGLRILLAEDGLINQQVATGLLKRRNHDVVIASDGAQAVAAWEKDDFDVILMDVQMPERDGFHATATIRDKEEQSERRTPIIAMAANAMKGDRERCLEAGMDGYVAKPIDPDQLFQALDNLARPTSAAPCHPETPRPSRITTSRPKHPR